MKTYNNIKEVNKDIKDGVLRIDDDIEIAFDGFEIDANIHCKNIYSKDYARNINARDINAWDINSRNINAWDINAWDINSRNINSRNINARDINAWDINSRNINSRNINSRNINARDINAWDINAWDISYLAVCFAYNNIKCKSIEGRRGKSKHFCLDGEITIQQPKETITIGGKTYSKEEVEEKLKDIKEL